MKKLLHRLSFIINHFPFNNRRKFSRGGVKVNYNDAILIRCKIICKGKGNKIEFEKGSLFRNCIFRISGDNNIIKIGQKVHAKNVEFWIEDNCNTISIGNNTSFCGKLHLACTEGKSITIGKECLFSSEIVFRTGDSHSIIDLSGIRINHAKDIIIGDHVWIGHRVLVNKGVVISNNSVVGTGSVVTKKFNDENIIIAGCPAKIVKNDINWLGKRI